MHEDCTNLQAKIKILIVTPPIGGENKKRRREKQLNLTTSAQIYSNKQIFNTLILYTIGQVTGSETLYQGLLGRSSGRYKDWSTGLSLGRLG